MVDNKISTSLLVLGPIRLFLQLSSGHIHENISYDGKRNMALRWELVFHTQKWNCIFVLRGSGGKCMNQNFYPDWRMSPYFFCRNSKGPKFLSLVAVILRMLKRTVGETPPYYISWFKDTLAPHQVNPDTQGEHDKYSSETILLILPPHSSDTHYNPRANRHDLFDWDGVPRFLHFCGVCQPCCCQPESCRAVTSRSTGRPALW